MFRVEICGNIASGKTTLCRGLAKIGCATIEETFLQNPFIEKFYQNPALYSFETEISFLLQHYHSIKVTSSSIFPVCDFSLTLDKAYAEVTLATQRKNIFLAISDEIVKEIGHPKLIIHLQCPEQILLERIQQRSRIFELPIEIDYLRSLSQAIEERVRAIASVVPVLTIDSNGIDFTESVEKIDALPLILRMIHQ
jgi:deoxyadenosine/deoxycytidine kinase